MPFHYPPKAEIAPNRWIARRRGKRFYQGSPCKRGHRGVRYIGNKACIECEAARGKAWKAAHKDSERIRRADLKRRTRAARQLARHEYERLLRMRQAAPAAALPVLILDELPLPAKRRYRRRRVAELSPFLQMIQAALNG